MAMTSERRSESMLLEGRRRRASDRAGALTGTFVNATCGSAVD
jgi:hypothetical protein